MATTKHLSPMKDIRTPQLYQKNTERSKKITLPHRSHGESSGTENRILQKQTAALYAFKKNTKLRPILKTIW